MHFALLGHEATYRLERVDLIFAIEAWAAANYHLVLLDTNQGALAKRALRKFKLPVARTWVHAMDTAAPAVRELYVQLTVNTTSGPGAIPCWKLFVPFLPSFASVDSLIFLDSDILLLQDPRLLWAHFGHFLPTHVLGLALNHDGMIGLNSGVLLLRLDRMRGEKSKWMQALKAGMHALKHGSGAPGSRYKAGIKLGWLADQTLLSYLAGWQFPPGGATRLDEYQTLFGPFGAPLFGKLYTMPCGWNRQLSIHAAQQPNFWPAWASCTEPCHLAHFSGVFFKPLLNDLTVTRSRSGGNLTRGRCSRVVHRHMTTGEWKRDPNAQKMLKFVRNQCCSQLPGGLLLPDPPAPPPPPAPAVAPISKEAYHWIMSAKSGYCAKTSCFANNKPKTIYRHPNLRVR